MQIELRIHRSLPKLPALGKDREKTFCAFMANDGDECDGHDSDVAEEQQYVVHIRNVPKTSSLSDVNALFVRAGFSPPFSFPDIRLHRSSAARFICGC